MNARALYRLIGDRIPGTLAICRFDQAAPSVWCDPCSTRSVDSENYVRGQRLLLERLAALKEPG